MQKFHFNEERNRIKTSTLIKIVAHLMMIERCENAGKDNRLQ